jgi:hypothetical protein
MALMAPEIVALATIFRSRLVQALCINASPTAMGLDKFVAAAAPDC